jgi:hypothetical protein
MIFSGKSLILVRKALDLAIAELHNQIATCPDVIEYEDDILEIEAEQKKYQKLIDRIDRKFPKDGS